MFGTRDSSRKFFKSSSCTGSIIPCYALFALHPPAERISVRTARLLQLILMSNANTVGTTGSGASWPGWEKGSSEYRRILIALLGAGIATFAQLYSPQGVLPLVAADMNVDASSASLAISAATAGLALSVLPWSLVADRIGRIRSMRIALVLAVGIGLLVPWVPWFEAFIALRVLEGIALGGIPGVAVAYLSEEVSKKAAAIAAGTYVSGTTIGGLLGRIVAAPIADAFDWRIGTFAVAVLAAVAAVVFFVVTPEPQGFVVKRVSPSSVFRATAAHMKNPRMLMIYGQAFLLMGGFVTMYNYLTFRLETPPFLLPVGLASLLFLAYLAGTVTSRIAGGQVMRFGRKPVLLVSIAVMIAGVLMTLAYSLPFIILGLVILTGGFFGAHSVASGWAGARAEENRSQSTSLYNFWYYAGSSVFGYLGGFAFVAFGWAGVVGMVTAMAVIAAIWAMLDPGDAHTSSDRQ